MPRTILTTLTAVDYRNLQQTYSEKNIINQTSGHEYVISTATRTNLTDLLGRSTSVTIPTVSFGQRCTDKDFNSDKYSYFMHTINVYVRAETIITEGTISIETDQIITDPNTISMSWTINYDHYFKNYGKDWALNAADAKSSNAIYKGIEQSQYKQNTEGYLTTSTVLPENSAYAGNFVFGVETYEIARTKGMSLTGWEGINTPRVKKLQNNHYQIEIDYRFATWWGYNRVKANKFEGITDEEITLYVARRIDFTVSANTVEASEIEFGYRSAIPLVGGAKGKNYEIASNEFLQTDEGTNPSQRQSATLSNEIFDKFDTDRTIVSFILLNCEKYTVDNEERYLQAEDLIYIKDENGEYLMDDDAATGNQTPSVFEIIKTRPIWNGSFEMEVTCRKVDMTI